MAGSVVPSKFPLTRYDVSGGDACSRIRPW